MCGIFGQISRYEINQENFNKLVKHSEQRGIDSSGLIYYKNNKYEIARADYNIEKLLKKVKPYDSKIALGHSRLITNGLGDNQPVIRDNICAIHNGIIVNEKEVWEKLTVQRKYKIDSEAIVAIAEEYLKNSNEINELPNKILNICRGVVACALVLAEYGKLLLFSNNGSLYVGYIEDDIYFASERYALDQIKCKNIKQIKNEALILDIPSINQEFIVRDETSRTEDLIPEFKFNQNEDKLLEFKTFKEINLKRCTKCILPETMPFIRFDEEGICNYCHNYKKRNKPKPKEELFKLVEPYRRTGKELDCIVPFSGGRDSCYGLHLIVKELEMKPVTYTYDWGMVTDLGRRNISQMCGDMGVENIIVAADISQKKKKYKNEFTGLA